MSDLTGLTKSSLAFLGIIPRKKWGQNFMIREGELSFIADSLEVQSGELVLEIGPGLGFLTKELLQRGARVIAVEKDRILADHLRNMFKGRTLEVVSGDVLEFSLKKIADLKAPIKVIGNIPYNITSPILEWLITQRSSIYCAVLTVQQEVAQRLVSSPGSKVWGALSVFVQFYTRIKILKKVGKGHFFPPPEVDSAVIFLDFSGKPPYFSKNEELFFGLVRHSFQQRRKTLLNSLAGDKPGEYPKEKLLQALEKAKIDPMRRPETLSIPEWVAFSDAISC